MGNNIQVSPNEPLTLVVLFHSFSKIIFTEIIIRIDIKLQCIERWTVSGLNDPVTTGLTGSMNGCCSSSFCLPIFHVTFKWSEVWSANTKMINIQRGVLRGFRGLSKWQLLPNRNGRKRSQFFSWKTRPSSLSCFPSWLSSHKLGKVRNSHSFKTTEVKTDYLITVEDAVIEVRCTQVCRVDFLLSKVHFHLLHGGRWDRSHLWPQFGRSVS